MNYGKTTACAGRALSCVLALLLLALLFVPQVSATDDGVVLSGSGSESDPYTIGSAEDMQKLAESCNGGESYLGKYIKLTADVSLAGIPWTAIGFSEKTVFSGIFDGDGHRVTDLYINAEGESAGLFGYIVDGQVKNLTVIAGNVVSAKYAGAIVGHLSATKSGRASIFNCHARVESIKGREVGGIVGRASAVGADLGAVSIKGCSAKVVATTHSGGESTANCLVGGIAGVVGGGVLDGCFVYDSVIEGGDGGEKTLNAIGGLVGCQGASLESAAIYNSYVVDTKVKLLPAAVSEKSSVGGLVGRAAHVSASEIFNCFTIRTVAENHIENGIAGSFIGQAANYILFNNCYTDTEKALGADSLNYGYPIKVLTAEKFAALDNVSLGIGNSEAIWTASAADGHPVIDITKLEANHTSYTPFDINDTYTAPDDETTKTPDDETTKTPDDETTALGDETTESGDITTNVGIDSGNDTDGDNSTGGGCASFGASVFPMLVITLAFVPSFLKKRK